MSEALPVLMLPVAKPTDGGMILLSIVVGGKITEFHLSRETAAALVSRLAEALAQG